MRDVTCDGDPVQGWEVPRKGGCGEEVRFGWRSGWAGHNGRLGIRI